jgi:hypothetical protein
MKRAIIASAPCEIGMAHQPHQNARVIGLNRAGKIIYGAGS